MTGERKLFQEPMLELYIYETMTLLEQLEEVIVGLEPHQQLEKGEIEEIVFAVHAIKGSSAMMLFLEIANVAHSLECLFNHFKEDVPGDLDHESMYDLVLDALDFIRSGSLSSAQGSH